MADHPFDECGFIWRTIPSLFVEDTHFNGHPILPNHGPGPWEAVDEFLATTSDFTIDRSPEKFLFTFNPRGFLKRR